MNGLVRGEEEDYSSNDDAKNPEEGVDAAMEGSGVWIGFRRHVSGGRDIEVTGQRSENDNCGDVSAVRIR